MSHQIKKLFAVLAMSMVVAFAAPAQADQVDFTNPAFAPVGGLTSIPVGAADFCKSNRGECQANPNGAGAVALTQQRWDELVQVNNLVNAAITPITDQDYYQVAEYWAYPDDGYGDCEDFALAKRRALIEAGWPSSTLMVSVVREANGNGHAVLMVRTDRGDLVLDNQDGRVLLWNETPYTYLKRQSQADAAQWIDLLDTRTTMVAARQ